MYSDILIFRNELKSKTIYKYKIDGIICELILSKQIFAKNSEIKDFVQDVFFIELKDYVLKSRTLILAHLIKKISAMEVESYHKNLIQFINNKIEFLKELENFKEPKNEFDGWIK